MAEVQESVTIGLSVALHGEAAVEACPQDPSLLLRHGLVSCEGEALRPDRGDLAKIGGGRAGLVHLADQFLCMAGAGPSDATREQNLGVDFILRREPQALTEAAR